MAALSKHGQPIAVGQRVSAGTCDEYFYLEDGLVSAIKNSEATVEVVDLDRNEICYCSPWHIVILDTPFVD